MKRTLVVVFPQALYGGIVGDAGGSFHQLHRVIKSYGMTHYIPEENETICLGSIFKYSITDNICSPRQLSVHIKQSFEGSLHEISSLSSIATGGVEPHPGRSIEINLIPDD